MNLWKLFVVTVSIVPLSLLSFLSIGRFEKQVTVLVKNQYGQVASAWKGDSPNDDDRPEADTGNEHDDQTTTALRGKSNGSDGKDQDAAALREKSDRSGAISVADSGNEKSKAATVSRGKSSDDSLPLLILHVGPRATGAETIQSVAARYEGKLKKDNIVFLGHNSSERDQNTHQIYVECITHMQDHDGRMCNRRWENFDRILERHRQRKQNVFVSDELFSSFTDRLNVEHQHLWKQLIPRLKGKWRVRVIFSYRRYYEWVVSRYSQLYNPNPDARSFGELVEIWPDLGGRKIHSFRTFYEAVRKNTFKYPPAMKERWSDKYNVEIFNYHSDGNVIENFFCDMVPEAARLCQLFRTDEVESQHQDTSTSIKQHYNEAIAAAAYKRGWVDKSHAPSEIIKAVASFAEKQNDSPPLDCLSPSETDELLKLSLSMEEEMLPEFFASDKGETVLKSEFRALSEAGSFCSVDTESILSDDEWKHVFDDFRKPALTGNGATTDLPVDYPQLDVDLAWLGIGAQGAGTTWLANMLSDCCSSVVGLSFKKEIHFWDWYRQKGLGWYSEQFPNRTSSEIFHGEFSPHYMSLPEEDIREIRALFPSVRLIFVARDLVERTWSGIRKTVRRYNLHGTLDSINPANYTDEFFMKKAAGRINKERSAYDIGMKRWYSHFPADQILILNFDDIANDPVDFVRKVLVHIGVPNPESYLKAIKEEQGEKINPGVYTDIRPSLRKKLEDLFRPTSQEFNKLLRENDYDWQLNEYQGSEVVE